MLFTKPDTCKGCPFYDKSRYFTPDVMYDGSEILILAQNPGEDEEKGHKIVKYDWFNNQKKAVYTSVIPQPLIGNTGYKVEHELLPLAKLASNTVVSKANVIKCRPNGKNELPEINNKALREAIVHCTTHHLEPKLPSKLKYILSLGNISLWYASRQRSRGDSSKQGEERYAGSLFNWRGYALPFYGIDETLSGIKPIKQTEYFDITQPGYRAKGGVIVFPTIHPASLYKGENKRFYHAVLSDFKKFGKLVRHEWPNKLPHIRHNELPSVWPSISGFDTEYDPLQNDKLIRWSMSNTKGEVYVVEADVSQKVDVAPNSKIWMQNLLADISHLSSVIDLDKGVHVHDTMLAHSVLWTGEPHSLDYLCSIYGSLNRHKHLFGDNEVLYSGLDAYTTINDVARGLLAEFKSDYQSWLTYVNRRLPLTAIIAKAEARGIKIDHHRLYSVFKYYEDRIAALQERARIITGDDKFNLGSNKQVSEVLYGTSE